MTPQVKDLVRTIVYRSDTAPVVKHQVRRVLDADNTVRDAAFRDEMRIRLEKGDADAQKKIAGLATIEAEPQLNLDRFLPTEADCKATATVIEARKIADRLDQMGVHYLPSVLLYGATGCGKTTFARYLAAKAGLPFVITSLHNVVDALLGQTDKNLAKVFEYAASEPCVLCLDEIDALAIRRGQEDSTGAISRACITLMQMLDQMPNTTIIVATTNRFEDLDPAFIRRFQIQHEVKPLSQVDAQRLCKMFFRSTLGYVPGNLQIWQSGAPAYAVINRCTEELIHIVAQEQTSLF